MTIEPHAGHQPAVPAQHGQETVPAQQTPQAPAVAGNPLIEWAQAARQAHQIAESLARTSFVPRSLQGKPGDITAAILTGQELGMQPMAALRSLDIIQGTPALRAHAMRALVQSHGHQIQVVESTPVLCVMRGRRKGDEEWQTVEWSIERAQQLGLTSKDQWRKQPQAMLIARATSEICRLIAADVLFAVPYATEELVDQPVEQVPPRVTVEEIRARGQGGEAQPQAGEQPRAVEQQAGEFAELPAGEAEGWDTTPSQEPSGWDAIADAEDPAA